MTLNKVKPGFVIDNMYSILKVVAKGAMGGVFKAKTLTTQEIVAIKVPLEGYDKELSSVQRFAQSEKIQNMLDHPHIVKAYIPDHKKSMLYLIMEFVDGPSLEYMLSQRKRLEIQEVIDLSLQMCSVLQYLQEHGIVHHDIKPSNIIILDNKILKLTDFGISFSESLKTEIWASLCSVGGTPAYIAPEKVRDHAINDYRSDIFSLGVLMYLMSTGRLPFSGSLEEIIGAQITQNFLSPSVLNTRIHPVLEKIILRCLSPDPKDRYQTARELSSDLERAKMVRQKTYEKDAKEINYAIPIWLIYFLLAAVLVLAFSIGLLLKLGNS